MASRAIAATRRRRAGAGLGAPMDVLMGAPFAWREEGGLGPPAEAATPVGRRTTRRLIGGHSSAAADRAHEPAPLVGDREHVAKLCARAAGQERPDRHRDQ